MLIQASLLKNRQKLHLLVLVIIKSAILLRFTNPSKRSTFNVRLVSDEFQNNSTYSFSGRRVNKLVKFLSTIAHIFLNFTANHTKFYGDVGFR